jgi:hypothetical protein
MELRETKFRVCLAEFIDMELCHTGDIEIDLVRIVADTVNMLE